MSNIILKEEDVWGDFWGARYLVERFGVVQGFGLVYGPTGLLLDLSFMGLGLRD